MALTVTQIQQLYTAYLGRAVDQEGVDYWTDAELDLTVADLRFNLANENQPEYVELYGNLSREDLVKAIYQNMFNRPADDDGLAYWTTGEGSVVPANELQQLFIEAASDEDKAAFEAEVQADLEEYEAGDTSGLTEALNDLSAAQDAKADFLAGLELDLDNDGTIDVEAGKATEPNVATDLTNAIAGVDAEVTGDYVNASENVKAALLADQQEANAKALAAAEKTLAEAEAEVAKVAGLETAVSNLQAAEDSLVVAQKAQATATAAQNGAEASYESLNSSVTINADGTIASLIVLNSDQELELADGITEETNEGVTALLNAINGRLAAEAATADAQDAVNAAQEVVDNLDLTPAAESALSDVAVEMGLDAEATPSVAEIESAIAQRVAQLKTDATASGLDLSTVTWDHDADGGTTPAVAVDLTNGVDAGESEAILTAATSASAQDAILDDKGTETTADDTGIQADINALAEAVAEMEAAQANADELEGLNDAIDAAEKAFTDNDYLVPVSVDGAELATAESDIFLAGETDGSIANFGLLGEDTLYVSGATYNSAVIGAGTDEVALGKAGDDAAVEFFLQETGSGVDVIIEDKAFGSSAETPEVTTITLTGAKLADVNVDDGFITVA